MGMGLFHYLVNDWLYTRLEGEVSKRKIAIKLTLKTSSEQCLVTGQAFNPITGEAKTERFP